MEQILLPNVCSGIEISAGSSRTSFAAADAQVSLELLGGIFERIVCTAIYREVKFVIDLVRASKTKKRTLREVPLANGRLDEDCVSMGNDCMYKRHYRKYSRISRYNLMVSKRQEAARRQALCAPLDPHLDTQRILKMVSIPSIIPGNLCFTY